MNIMEDPVIEYSLCIFNHDRSKLLKRLALLAPAPIYPIGHKITIDDDSYVVTDSSMSITSNDSGSFTTYVTELIVFTFGLQVVNKRIPLIER